MSIFQEQADSSFKRVKIYIEIFGHDRLYISRGKKVLEEMILQDEKLSFFELKAHRVLFAYVEGDDFSKAYPMPYMKAFSLSDLGLTDQHQKVLADVRKEEESHNKNVQELVKFLIEHASTSNVKKTNVILEVQLLAASNPQFLQAYRDLIASFK